MKWNTSQGETTGKVVRRQASPITIKHHRVAASKNNPECVVKSDKSGDIAGHKPESLRRA